MYNNISELPASGDKVVSWKVPQSLAHERHLPKIKTLTEWVPDHFRDDWKFHTLSSVE